MSQCSTGKNKQEDEKAGQQQGIVDHHPDSGYFSPSNSTFDFNESSASCSSSSANPPRSSTPKSAVVAGGEMLDWDITRSQVFQRRRSLSEPGLSPSFRSAYTRTSFNAMVDTVDAATQTDSSPPPVDAAAASDQLSNVGHVPPNNHLVAAAHGQQHLAAVHVIHAGAHHQIAIEFGNQLAAMGDMFNAQHDIPLALNAAFNHPLIAVRVVVGIHLPALPPWARNAVRWLAAVTRVLLYPDNHL